MFIVKRIAMLVVMIGFAIGSSSLIAVSAQDKKKIEERKAQRTKEKTKGKASSKAQSVKKPLAVKRSIAPVTVKAPVKTKAPVTKVSVSTKTPVAGKPSVQKVDIATLPAPITSTYYGTEIIDIPMPTDLPPMLPEVVEPTSIDVDMPPTDMPAKLRVALIAMLPDNVKDRVETIIIAFSSDAQTLFKNIYLLCWIDDELMKTFNSSDFYSTLLTVISQECNMSYAAVEAMAMAMKDKIDSTLVRFENAITTGDMSNFEIKQVQDLFKGESAYREYLERCLRLANEYNQSKMITVLKLALANADSASELIEEDDFDY